jgi:hypothetical protein
MTDTPRNGLNSNVGICVLLVLALLLLDSMFTGSCRAYGALKSNVAASLPPLGGPITWSGPSYGSGNKSLPDVRWYADGTAPQFVFSATANQPSGTQYLWSVVSGPFTIPTGGAGGSSVSITTTGSTTLGHDADIQLTYIPTSGGKITKNQKFDIRTPTRIVYASSDDMALVFPNSTPPANPSPPIIYNLAYDNANNTDFRYGFNFVEIYWKLLDQFCKPINRWSMTRGYVGDVSAGGVEFHETWPSGGSDQQITPGIIQHGGPWQIPPTQAWQTGTTGTFTGPPPNENGKFVPSSQFWQADGVSTSYDTYGTSYIGQDSNGTEVTYTTDAAAQGVTIAILTQQFLSQGANISPSFTVTYTCGGVTHAAGQ